MSTTVAENEIAYHREDAARIRESLAPLDRAVVRRYEKTAHWRLFATEYIFKHLKDLAAAKAPETLTIGDFGCGDGTNVCLAAKVLENATFIGFDLSPDMIELARERAALNGVDGRARFFVANAEDDDPLGGERVDVMLCLSILHHVELEAVVPNLVASTRPGGVIVIREPIAFSSTLQRLRDASGVEKDITPDERQLSRAEVDYLLGLLEAPVVRYSRLVARLARFLPETDKGPRAARALAHALFWIDDALLTLAPPLKRYCGSIVIIGRRGNGAAPGATR